MAGGTLARPLRVCLTGWLNLNVVDGSAFFITSLASILARDPTIEITIPVPVPVKRDVVLGPLRGRNNVAIRDPFEERPAVPGAVRSLKGQSTTPGAFATYINELGTDRPFDVILVRGLELATELANLGSVDVQSLLVYVTGITSTRVAPEAEVVHAYQELSRLGAGFVCQTPEMAEVFERSVLGDYSTGRTWVLSPIGGEREVTDLPPVEHGAAKFVFASKFFADWLPLETISQFRQVHHRYPSSLLEVAGDAFRPHPTDPGYLSRTRDALVSGYGVRWHGAIQRQQVRSLIRESHVGLSWRSSNLDDSLELSTKLLEFGGLGRPVIVNRTSMHESLLGKEYPLFANSPEEFRDALKRCIVDRVVLLDARSTVIEATAKYGPNNAFFSVVTIFKELLGGRRGSGVEVFGLADASGHIDGIAGADLSVAEGVRFIGPLVLAESKVRGRDRANWMDIDPHVWSHLLLRWAGMGELNGALGEELRKELSTRDREASRLQELAREVDLCAHARLELQGKVADLGERLKSAIGEGTAVRRELDASRRRVAALESGFEENRGLRLSVEQSALTLRERDREVAVLQERIRGYEERLSATEKRIASLKRSKLGRVQVWWWERRSQRS